MTINNEIVALLEGVLVVLGSIGIKGIRDIKKQLVEQNGSLRELKVWQATHNKQDDDRHNENLGRFNEISTEMRDLTNRTIINIKGT